MKTGNAGDLGFITSRQTTTPDLAEDAVEMLSININMFNSDSRAAADGQHK